jgi:hypothetical protein
MNEQQFLDQIEQLQKKYSDAKREWVITSEAKKDNDDKHQENIEALKIIQSELLSVMVEAGVDVSETEDLTFTVEAKPYNVVDEKGAIAAIKAMGLADQFIKPTQTGLKKHKLTQFITQETAIGLKVKVKD